MPDLPRQGRKRSDPSVSQLIRAETCLFPPQPKTGLPIALGYPHSYSVAMSNLGFHQVYRLLHERPDVQVQRFFWTRESRGSMTFEEGRPLGAFRVVAFSLPYEADYSRVVACLRAAGIPLRREERSWHDPFIVLGGIAITANPLPLAPLADMIILGEAEEALPRVLDLLLPALYEERHRDKAQERIVHVQGVYAPSFGEDAEIQRIPGPRLGDFPAHSAFLTPYTVFRNTFLVEIGRGCHRACRFCLTGNLMRGSRTRSADSVLQQVEERAGAAEKIGLVSPEVTSHPELHTILERLIAAGRKITLSSVETDRLDPQLISLLARAGLQTLTIAPECGTDSLRRSLGKTYTNRQILDTVAELARSSIRKLKLYYLVGLPGSGPDEVPAIVQLTAKIAQRFQAGHEGKVPRELGVTLSPLIPKPFTPLAAFPMMESRELRHRLRATRAGLARIPGVKASTASVSEAETEYRIGAGDNTTFDWLLETAF